MGFKDLKIGPPDEALEVAPPRPPASRRGRPVFEVKDGYAKITVAMPEKADKADKD